MTNAFYAASINIDRPHRDCDRSLTNIHAEHAAHRHYIPHPSVRVSSQSSKDYIV